MADWIPPSPKRTVVRARKPGRAKAIAGERLEYRSVFRAHLDREGLCSTTSRRTHPSFEGARLPRPVRRLFVLAMPQDWPPSSVPHGFRRRAGPIMSFPGKNAGLQSLERSSGLKSCKCPHGTRRSPLARGSPSAGGPAPAAGCAHRGLRPSFPRRPAQSRPPTPARQPHRTRHPRRRRTSPFR